MPVMTDPLRDGPGLKESVGATSPFFGTSEMANRCRAFDWSTTPLGPVSGWSQALRTTVSTMLESRHPMFLWWGPELVQIYNDGYLPSFGTTGRDVAALGARGRDHWAEIWPIIGPQIEGVMTRAEATWHENDLVPIERNGRLEEVWWTYGYSPVRDDDGSVGGVLVVVQETTAHVLAVAERELLLAAERTARAESETLRAQAETATRRLHELFQQAPAFIAVVRGRDFVFELVNDAYYQLVGYRAVLGKPLFEAIPDIRGQGFEDLLLGVLDSGKAYLGHEAPLKIQRTPNAEPELRYVDFVYAPLTEADGSRSGVFLHGVDVTEQVESRKTVDVARAAAEAANRAKSEFLAIMSHELRTPLNAIGGYAELIELGIHGPVTIQQTKALARIQESQRHLLGLINGVLNYSRVEAGHVSYAIEDVELDEVLSTCEALIAPQVRAKQLDLHCVHDVRISARADREKVQQIMLNLLSNAVKFTEPGGSITVDCGIVDQNVAIHVADTGRGIPADKIDLVFQPFVQVDSKLTRTQEGTGLGLAISRDLARGMGGDLTAVSAVGAGSTFTLTLPAA
jgi:signal transduction histidine kinase